MKRKLKKISPKSPNIVATSQVSRFHTETLETLSNDVNLRGVHISIDDRELLIDTELKIFRGVHYGLVGGNGAGKSTLLKCISKRILIGLPPNIDALYVEQFEIFDKSSSVLDSVIASDQETAKLMQQLTDITKALEQGENNQLVSTLRKQALEDLKSNHSIAEANATKRSGARGARARRKLNEIDQLVKSAENFHLNGITDEDENSAVFMAHSKVNDIQEMLAIREADSIDSRARKILLGLGFTKEMAEGPLANLSGGWRIRAALASALLIKPSILLLDEPTNHLDLPTILWLEDYLRSLTTTSIIVVSHDRAFLNAVTDETIILKDHTLVYYAGGYDQYRENLQERQNFLRNKKEAMEKKKSAAEATVTAEITKARKAGNDKKLAALASKHRKLKDSVQMDKNTKGHRFKLNRDLPGFHFNTREAISIEAEELCPKWKLPNPVPLRNSSDILILDEVTFQYGPQLPIILKAIMLQISQNSRVGLVGANGRGKSTLLKLMMDVIQPVKGDIKRHGNAVLGYFSQHKVDELRRCDTTDTPISILSAESEKAARSLLGQFGITGNVATSPLVSLSGGELTRVALARLFVESVPHLLILDEPTNHLDFLAIEALTQSLQNFKGAAVIASHDQHFITHTCDQLYIVDQSEVKLLDSLEEYLKMVRRGGNE